MEKVPVPELFIKERWESVRSIHAFDQSTVLTRNAQQFLDALCRQNASDVVDKIKIVNHVL